MGRAFDAGCAWVDAIVWLTFMRNISMKLVVLLFATLSLSTCAFANFIYVLPTSFQLTFGGPGGIQPRHNNQVGTSARWAYTVSLWAVQVPNQPLGGNGSALIGGWTTDYGTTTTRPGVIDWNTLLQRLSSPNPQSIDPYVRDRLRDYQYVCAYNDVHTNSTSALDYVPLSSCVRVDSLNIKPLCLLSLSPTIDFGVVPTGTTTIRQALTGVIQCDADSTVTITAGNIWMTQSRVDVSDDGLVYADIDVHQNPGLTGVTFTMRPNQPRSFGLGATLTAAAGAVPGRYTEVALVRIDWP